MKTIKRFSTLLLCAILSMPLVAQEEETGTTNIQEFTPSKLLRKGQWDIKFFNGLYTQTRVADDSGNITDADRQTFFTNTNEVYTGVSENRRINVGVIFQVRSNVLGGSALDALSFKNDNVTTRSGLSTIAPSIRVQPFKNISNFSFTSSFYIPVFEDKPSPVFFDKRSYFWETRFFYDKTFGGNKWQLFTQADFGYNFGEKSVDASEDENSGERFANNSLFLPLSAFLSYFPSAESTLFVNVQQAFLIDLGNDFSQNYTQLGIGGKYQITEVLNLEASYGTFVRGNSTGIGQTFSLGLRALF
ncbi:hypothetical protein NBT05_03120 [Aquimarina sp. ERC-38]|uniref:hypothetical protein n=1 Tax=Aquimarina sp. ERC-38 TaxID=2949996 RepID=UPI0022463EB6|nr:hypothetical protein [Aquimarina sp. ERC-38]UZO81472.1 hypothetical protein NBT05_03120 [Aquimarina sp. ERC-38]